MDRTKEVNQIQEYASDLLDQATCTLQEFGGDAEKYIDAIIEMCNADKEYDEHDRALLRRFMLRELQD